MPNKLHRWALAISVFILLIIIGGLAYLSRFVRVITSVSKGVEFDRREWLAHPEHKGEETVRSEMGYDVPDELTKGMHRAEVLKLLGAPTRSLPTNSSHPVEDQYALSDSETLVVRYDRVHSKVVGSEVR